MASPDPLDGIDERLRRIASSSPPSGGPDIRIEGMGVDFRLRKRSVPGWAWVPILAALSAIGSGVTGYYEGLRQARLRVIAVEESQKLQSEQIARMLVQLKAANEAIDHEVVVNRSQDSKIGRLETAVPLVVKP